jgi:2-iminobutanoate/2-iminopropanoate deaminase
MIYISGQIPLNVESNELITGDIATETHQVMRNLQAILQEAKITFNHVVKSTIFLTDMNLFAAVNEVYGSYFSGDYPARETVAVKGLPKNVNVEISMIATV